MPPRPEHVLEIVNAVLDTIHATIDDETSASELFGVACTILARFVQVMTENGMDPEELRRAAMRAFPAPMPKSSTLVH